MSSEEFDAKSHWKEFELLAVKIVSLVIDGTLVYDDIIERKVPITRDHGIDGHLIITLQNNKIEITIEAKLRSKGKLSLKDFATSILNYLLNEKDLHFIITNVEFTKDAIDVVEGLNRKQIKHIYYYNGYNLLNIMNQNHNIREEYPSIYDNLASQKFTIHQKQDNDCLEYKVKPYPLTKSRQDISGQIRDAIANGIKLIIITGQSGTGKSFVIQQATKNTNREIIDIDLSYTTSLRIFAISLVESVVNIDIFKIIDCLSEEDKKEVEKSIDHYYSDTDEMAQYLKQILNLNLTDDSFGYIIKRFVETFINHIKEEKLVYIHNINKSTFETVSFLFQMMSLFLSHDITVIIEMPDSMDICPYLSESECHTLRKELKILNDGNVLSTAFNISEFDENEAIEFLNMFQLPNTQEYFLKSIIYKYGYNPEMLFNIADYVISNHVTTASEITAMNIYEQGLISIEDIYNYLQTKTYGEQNIIVFCLMITFLLGHKINLTLLPEIDKKFKNLQTYKILLDTKWFYRKDNNLYVKKYISKNTLSEFSYMNNIQDASSFLLENKLLWEKYFPDYKYMECNLLYITNDSNFLAAANNTLNMLNRIQNNSIAILLLDKCRIFSSNIDAPTNIKYSIMYLEALEPEKYLEYAISCIMDDVEKQCLMLIASNKKSIQHVGYEYLIRLKIIYYKKHRSAFDFFTAEKYVDEGLKIETVYTNARLMNRLYVYKALCVKERGFKDEFLEYFRRGIRKYPNESYVKVCYCSNVSSYYFKRNRKRSRTYLRRGIQCATKNGHKLMTIWLQHNLIICNLYDTNFEYDDFDALYNLRQQADKAGSIADISRSYNIEGCLMMARKQYQKAIKCFNNAINLFNKNVTEQMIFLFRINLIVALSHANKNIYSEIDDVFNWLETTHDRIYTKLSNAPIKGYENNYAAIISLLKLSVKIENALLSEKLLSFFPFPELKDIYSRYKNDYAMLETELNKLIDLCYINNHDILILF